MNEEDEIEQAAALAEAETCARGGGAKIPLCMKEDGKMKARRWTEEENDYIRENYKRTAEEDMAAYLGRSSLSVHLHIKRDLHLVAITKTPDILTAEQLAWGLGTDGKIIHLLMDSGRMPHRLLPGIDKTRVIDRRVLMRWMLEPMHWVYFKPERVGAMRPRGKRLLSDCYDFGFWGDARKVMQKARAAWRDEWLTPGQAAEAVGIRRGRSSSHSINKAILVGNLKAVRWGNWHILRSQLPPAGMTFNVAGRIVKIDSIGRKHCSQCGKIGHNKCHHRSAKK